MLKIEKTARTEGISLSIRSKDPFFSRSFTTALFFAVAFHVIAFIFFKVGPLRLQYSNHVSPAVTVNADLGGEMDALVRAYVDEEEIPKKYIFEPPIPVLSSMPQIETLQKMENLRNPFLAKEKEITFQSNSLFEKPPKALHIEAFGSLGSPLNVATFKSFDQRVEPFRAHYIIRIDEEGHIFWYQQSRFDGKPVSEQSLIAILKQLQFNKGMMDRIGELEIAFKSG